MRTLVMSVAVGLALGGCTYAVKPTSAPAVNVYTTFDSKIPGRWVVTLDSVGTLAGQITMGSYACSAHNYPFDAGDSFKTSTISTLEQVFDTIEHRQAPPTREQMQSEGIAGVVMIRVDNFTPKATCTQGFWSMSCTSNVELALGVKIEGPNGSLFASSVGSQRSADGDAGGACGGVSNVVSDAYRNSLRETMERLAERVGSAPKLRETAPTAP